MIWWRKKRKQDFSRPISIENRNTSALAIKNTRFSFLNSGGMQANPFNFWENSEPHYGRFWEYRPLPGSKVKGDSRFNRFQFLDGGWIILELSSSKKILSLGGRHLSTSSRTTYFIPKGFGTDTWKKKNRVNVVPCYSRTSTHHPALFRRMSGRPSNYPKIITLVQPTRL